MATTLRVELPPSLSEDEARLLFAVKLYEVCQKILPGLFAITLGAFLFWP